MSSLASPITKPTFSPSSLSHPHHLPFPSPTPDHLDSHDRRLSPNHRHLLLLHPRSAPASSSHVALVSSPSSPASMPILSPPASPPRAGPNKLRKSRVGHAQPLQPQPLSITFSDLNLDLSLGSSGSRGVGPLLSIPVSSIAATSQSQSQPLSVSQSTTSAPCSPSRPLHSSPLTSPPSSTHGGSFSSSRSNASLSRSNSSTSARKLTKRRPSLLATIPQARSVPPSSSQEAAYAAASALSLQPHPPEFLMDHTPPSYTQSDVGHGANLTPKRGSIIRRFSMLSKKQTLDSSSSSSPAPLPESAARAKWTRWKKSKGTEPDSEQSEDKPLLPLLRVISPFSVSVPEQSPHRSTGIWGNNTAVPQPSVREDGPSSSSPPRFAADPLSSMLTFSDKDPPPTRSRPKFTLSNESDVDLSSDQHLSPSPSIHRPPPRPRLVRRDANVGTVGYGTQRRRWTLTMAMTDEDITDEVLVEELERVVLRMKDQWTGSLDDIPAGFGIWDAEMGRELWESNLESYLGRDGDTSDAGHSTETSAWADRSVIHGSPISESALPTGAKIPFTPSLPSFPLQHRLSTPAPASTATWQTARRALLTCRELVRTERHYLHSLHSLLASETMTPPPPLMLHYAGELVKVSEGLLGRMEENPSAWGVAAAFLGKEEGVETAFVSWCGVVGTWFVDDEKAETDRGRGSSRSASRKSSPVRRKLSKPSVADDKDKKVDADDETTLMSPLMRTVSTWRKSMPSISSMNESVSGNGGFSNPHFLSKRKERERNVSSSSQTPPIAEGTSKRKPSVRDLAILPTQRVMRYVLLYRDLLAHTPSTSPSRALVERAVEAACRIAQKCDRAQGNAVFFSGSAPKVDTSNTLTSATRPSSRRKLTLSMTPVSSRSRADQNAEL